ncbi:conserved hypothetical protein [Alkaliphilus metalliredigens QYMF]|uniref:GerMN domain-containing protein n=1 Tax=Alkaliphilus metalliredigens (strain QYMF) TaxID=293826 RepID=A6TLV7_ALKMQ|nr:GerMN domain-containing protein [Alkaliphilus metalliredigens]ABR47175.1 conserved hypothetical protein [Alkaliphilus metalliredigens QYMF]
MKFSRGITFVLLLTTISLSLLTACGNPLAKLVGWETVEEVHYVVDQPWSQDNELRETVLYYRDDKGLLIPVMRRIPWQEGIAKAALEQLVDQPVLRDDLATIGLLPVLPPGTEVIGISINEGLSKVDFNEQLLAYQSEIDENAIVKSIVYTLTEFDSIDQVQIMVNGEMLNKLTYGAKVSNPIERGNINLTDSMDPESVPVTLYYKGTVNGEDDFFIPITRGLNVLKADTKSVLTALVEGAPVGSGLHSEIPYGASINDVYVRDGIAYIDFTEEIRNVPVNEKHQQSLVYELGLTLREVEPSIHQVRILSGGKEVELGSNVSLNIPLHSNKY